MVNDESTTNYEISTTINEIKKLIRSINNYFFVIIYNDY